MAEPVPGLRHELRTHVNHVLGYSELLLDGIEGPEQEFLYRPLENVRLAATDALATLDRLVSLGKDDEDALTAQSVLDRAFEQVSRHVRILTERAQQSGQEAILVDLLRIDFAARHAAALVAHPLLSVHLLGPDIAGARDDRHAGRAAAVRPASPDRTAAEGAEPLDPPAPPGTILVVDDDLANRDVLARRLERSGHAVVTADNGRHALARLRETPVDLVLLDLMMPEMNGYEVLEVRRLGRDLRDIPVIMISADDEVDRVVECISLGADDYLTKPFDPVLLEARVGASLQKKRLRDQEKALLTTVQQQALELAELNETLEVRVHHQVEEIERLARLRRFLSPQLADVIVSTLDETTLQSHRREIAVLFCDLRGFTAFAETSEPEEVMSVLGEFHQVVGALIHRFEATVGFFAGDGLMVFFNDPMPCPDPAERAVSLGVAMRERIGELTPKWRGRGHDLGFAVGIAFGYATLGQIGFEGRFDYGVIGSVVNLAARLCDHAESNQILISGRAQMAVHDTWEVEDVGDLTLKGFHSRVPAYRVLGPMRPDR